VLRRPPPSASRCLDHEEVIAAEFDRHFGGESATTSVSDEEVPSRAAILAALESLRPKGTALRQDRRGTGAGEESNGAANAIASRMPASPAGAGDESVLLDPERVRELEGFDGRVAGVRHVGVDA